MKRLSLLLFSLFALTPVLQVQAMHLWRPKKHDTLGRRIVLPWIRALKVPISLVGALSAAIVGTKLASNVLEISGEGIPFPSASSVVYGMSLAYVAGVLYSLFVHSETPIQQTQDLGERLSDTVQKATFKPMARAAAPSAAIIVAGLPIAVLAGLLAGKDAVVAQLTLSNMSKAIQGTIAILGFAGAIEYLRQLTDFVSTQPQ